MNGLGKALTILTSNPQQLSVAAARLE